MFDDRYQMSTSPPCVEVEVGGYLLWWLRKVRERPSDVTPGVVGGETAHVIVTHVSWRRSASEQRGVDGTDGNLITSIGV